MPRFKIPPGFTIPEGAQEGEKFQIVVTGMVEGDEMEISEVEGITIPGYEESEEMEEQEEGDEEEEETEAPAGQTTGDRFNAKFRGKVAAY